MKRFHISFLTVALGAAIMAPSTSAATVLTAQTSGTSAALTSVSCPTEATCYATGPSAGVRRTTDGGSTWTQRSTSGLRAISCPSTGTCYGVSGTQVRKTTDGGTSWTTTNLGLSILEAIDCATVDMCIVGGAPTSSGANAAVTTNGTSWTVTSIGLYGPTAQWRPPLSHYPDPVDHPGKTYLASVACPSTLICYAVGNVDPGADQIFASLDGGSTWTNGAIPGNMGYSDFRDVACPTLATCHVVAGNGTNFLALASFDVARTLEPQVAPAKEEHVLLVGSLEGIACPAPGNCVAVGLHNDVLATQTAGEVWYPLDIPAWWTEQQDWVHYSDVSCPAVTRCYAVGEDGVITGFGL